MWFLQEFFEKLQPTGTNSTINSAVITTQCDRNKVALFESLFRVFIRNNSLLCTTNSQYA